jgi:predicted neuraminidase
VRAYDPALWHDPLGRLWLFWAQSYQFFDGRAGVWAIVAENPESEHPTWSAPRRMANGVMMNKPVVLGTGEWVLPAAVWSHQAKDRHRELAGEKFSNVVVSTDQGKTWSVRGGADVPDRTFDEQQVIERRDGTLWMLVRTKYGIGESISADRGKTWSPGRPSGLAHTSSRFFIRRLASGNLLLVKHSPPEGVAMGRSHLTAALSADDGKSWQGGLLLDERTGVSYPDGVQAKDGRIYIIYDFSRTKEREILMAVFTEADVPAGRCVSEGSRLRVPVNKASGKPPK